VIVWTGCPKEACWRLIIQHGIKGWNLELEIVREELVKSSIEVAAKKIDRTPKVIRDMLRRNRLSFCSSTYRFHVSPVTLPSRSLHICCADRHDDSASEGISGPLSITVFCINHHLARKSEGLM
jgi:hypothetical protein